MLKHDIVCFLYFNLHSRNESVHKCNMVNRIGNRYRPISGQFNRIGNRYFSRSPSPIRIDDVIILGHVIFASKDGSKSVNLRVQHLSGKCLGTHSVRTRS